MPPAIPNLDNLQALGQYLREVREGQHLKKEEVAQRLRVRLLYLGALESGDWSVLPGLAYGRGYLRRYASLLGLPEEEVMGVCDRLQGKVSSRLHYFETASTEQQPSRRILWFSLLAVMVMALAWYHWREQEVAAPEPDYTLPEAWSEAQQRVPEVTPSPYPPAAQECMKLLQVLQDPCYRDDRMIGLLDDRKSFFVITSP